jgi:predicted transposase YdaD
MNEEVRAEYDRRQKAWMDYQSFIEDSFLDGFEKGEAKGRAEGKAEGIEEALDLWRQGKTPEEVMRILGIGT